MQYAPDRLIGTLADMLGAQNEKHLSRLLKLSLPVVKGIRAGDVSVTPLILQQMAERVGTTVEALRVVLGDRRRKARMVFQLAAVPRGV